MKKEENLKETVYYVKGIHCASCEIVIEKRLLEEKGVEGVEASFGSNEVRVIYREDKPGLLRLNEIFKKEGYVFSNKKEEKEGLGKEKIKKGLIVLGVSLLVIAGFTVLNRGGYVGLVRVDLNSALPAFFIFGLLAGFSSCSALVGGVILSMSKQWSELYSKKRGGWGRYEPHILFNGGRLVFFGLFGAVLGYFGGVVNVLPWVGSVLAIGASVVMIILGLGMIGLRSFERLRFSMPRGVTRFVANEKNFKGRWMPFLMGGLTFFLPCGFTITTLGLALISGSAVKAGLIMLSFALGTLPALLLIGVTSVKFSERVDYFRWFTKIAGVLVLFFAVYNINAQLNVLGVKSFSDLVYGSVSEMETKDGFVPIVDGKQIVKMDALSYGYEPSRFKIRAGVPVVWEITDKGVSGCTNAVISKGLFEGEIKLGDGKVSVKEFVVDRVGEYKFSCWMGMVSGVFEVVDENGEGGEVDEGVVVESEAEGSCGCAGGER